MVCRVWSVFPCGVCLGVILLAMPSAAADTAAPGPAEMAATVDRLLADELGGDDSAPAAPRVNDETFLRRVFLDLLGETPTPDDVLAFAFKTSDRRRDEMVEQLLQDEAFGWNWARYWRDVIMTRRTEERALIVVPPLTSYLAEQFNQGVPWSDIVTRFITASGDVRENGDTALIMAQAGMPEDVTAEVSRIFLGIQIQCAQCHDHPTDRWKREQFHELAAFFPRIAVRPDRSGDTPTFLVTVNDRPFQFRSPNANNRFQGTPEHFMPNLLDPSDRGQQVQPVFFVSGDKLATGTLDADRRAALAAWVTSPRNPWFARAYVNRVWAELVGEGFYEPIDDLGPDRECSAPRTLDALSQGFVNSGHDVKWLYRTILSTDTYQRESRARRNVEERPFRANCAQRLRGDQLFDALVSALDLGDRVADRGVESAGLYQRRGGPRTSFNVAFGFDPSEPRAEVGGSIQQALLIMNAPFINQAISARRPDGLGQILRQNPDDHAVLVELYLKSLSRGPTEREVQTCLKYIAQVGNRSEAFEDIQWSLINSAEFMHRK